MGRQNLINKWLGFLLILGLVTAVISPACKFIAGQDGQMEICTAAGIIKIAAPTGDNQKSPGQNDDMAACPFCVFAHHAGTQAVTLAVLPSPPPLQKAFEPSARENILSGTISLPYGARAPPLFS